MKRLLACILFSVALYAAKKDIVWDHGKILSQDYGSEPAGAYAAPIGTASIAVPLYRRHNTVVIDTGNVIYTWGEIGTRAIILPVNGVIDFYRDGDKFIVLDVKNRKHKFTMLAQQIKAQ
jgi:hypothetical protein